MNDPNGPTLHYDRMIELNEFYKKASELFGPYIQPEFFLVSLRKSSETPCFRFPP